MIFTDDAVENNGLGMGSSAAVQVPTGTENTEKVAKSVVRCPRYLDTYRRHLRDDTSIAKVTIYLSISLQYKIP